MKKTSILFLTLMGTFLGILIFVAGMIVGNRLPRPVEDLASTRVPFSVTPPVQPASPQKLESKEVAEPVSEKPAIAEQEKPAVSKKTSPKTKPIARKPKHLVKASARKTPKEEVGDTLLPLPPSGNKKQSASIAEAKVGKPGTEKTPAIKIDTEIIGPFSYSVGLGAFLEREDAEELVADLKTKNHMAYIVNAWDSRGQLWSTVRIGHFADLDQASKTALELKQKERLMTYIQGMGSLGFVDISHIPEPKTAKTASAKTSLQSSQ